MARRPQLPAYVHHSLQSLLGHHDGGRAAHDLRLDGGGAVLHGHVGGVHFGGNGALCAGSWKGTGETALKGGENHGREAGIPQPCGASTLLCGARPAGGVSASAAESSRT